MEVRGTGIGILARGLIQKAIHTDTHFQKSFWMSGIGQNIFQDNPKSSGTAIILRINLIYDVISNFRQG